jgi:hypothetical protein
VTNVALTTNCSISMPCGIGISAERVFCRAGSSGMSAGTRPNKVNLPSPWAMVSLKQSLLTEALSSVSAKIQVATRPGPLATLRR